MVIWDWLRFFCQVKRVFKLGVYFQFGVFVLLFLFDDDILFKDSVYLEMVQIFFDMFVKVGVLGMEFLSWIKYLEEEGYEDIV